MQLHGFFQIVMEFSFCNKLIHEMKMLAHFQHFFAHAGIFEGSSGLLVFKQSMMLLVDLVVIPLNREQFFGAVLGGTMLVVCKREKNLC